MRISGVQECKKGENTPLLIRYKDLKQHFQEAKRKRLQRSSRTFFLARIEAAS